MKGNGIKRLGLNRTDIQLCTVQGTSSGVSKEWEDKSPPLLIPSHIACNRHTLIGDNWWQVWFLPCQNSTCSLPRWACICFTFPVFIVSLPFLCSPSLFPWGSPWHIELSHQTHSIIYWTVSFGTFRFIPAPSSSTCRLLAFQCIWFCLKPHFT